MEKKEAYNFFKRDAKMAREGFFGPPNNGANMLGNECCVEKKSCNYEELNEWTNGPKERYNRRLTWSEVDNRLCESSVR